MIQTSTSLKYEPSSELRLMTAYRYRREQLLFSKTQTRRHSVLVGAANGKEKRRGHATQRPESNPGDAEEGEEGQGHLRLHRKIYMYTSAWICTYNAQPSTPSRKPSSRRRRRRWRGSRPLAHSSRTRHSPCYLSRYIYVYVCMYFCVCVYVYIDIFAGGGGGGQGHLRIPREQGTRPAVSLHTYMLMYVCIYIHIYIHTYIEIDIR